MSKAEFDLDDVNRMRPELVAMLPVAPHELVLAEPGEPLRRMSRVEAADTFRASGLSALARRIERLLVPPSHIAVLSVSDARPPLLRLLPLEMVPMPMASPQTHPEPSCAPWQRFGGTR